MLRILINDRLILWKEKIILYIRTILNLEFSNNQNNTNNYYYY